MTRAFTLIELLVVVTILVVLLALLMPALTRAQYSAKVTGCAGQLKVITHGIITGAMDRNGRYPGRGSNVSQPHMLKYGGNAALDYRQEIKSYLGDLNRILTCPLCEVVDIEGSTTTAVYSTYWFFVGWNYNGAMGGPGMTRLGNRWTWDGREYGVMVQDYDVVNINNGEFSTHPDLDGNLDLVAPQEGALTYSSYFQQNVTLRPRGMVDMNFAYDDNSVLQFGNIPRSLWGVGPSDERFVQMPNARNGNLNGWGVTPKQ